MIRWRYVRSFVPLCVVTLMLACFIMVDRASARDYAIISNGTIEMGVWQEGNLNVPGYEPSSGETYYYDVVGLRYLRTGAEATAYSSPCEGWGVGDTFTGLSGYANECGCYDERAVTNLVLESFTSTESTATSVVLVCESTTDLAPAPSKVGQGGCIFRVTHYYHPTPLTPYLYQIDVTIENISSAITQVLYRRVMDWDIDPTPTYEFVTLSDYSKGYLFRTSTDGFNCSDPFTYDSYDPPEFVPGPVTDLGPNDLGALFDFNFGKLGPGGKIKFATFYGAAGTTADTLISLYSVGVETYSLGKPTKGGYDTGLSIYEYGVPWNDQNTFTYGAKNITCLTSGIHKPCTDEVVSFEKGGRRMHFNTTYQDVFGEKHITQVKLKITRGGEEAAKPAKVKSSSLPAAVAILTYDVATNQLKLEEFIEGKPLKCDGDEPWCSCDQATGACTVGVCTPGDASMVYGRLLTLDCFRTNVTGAENTLKVQWLVKAKPKFKGEKDLWLYVKV